MPKHFDDHGAGPSQRQLRVGETIRRVLAETLARGDLHEPELARMVITVTEVRTSPDLKIATAYISPLGGGDGEGAVKALARAAGELRCAVGKHLRLKYTPTLRFRLDDSFDKADATRALLSDPRVRRDVEAGRARDGGREGEDFDDDAD